MTNFEEIAKSWIKKYQDEFYKRFNRDCTLNDTEILCAINDSMDVVTLMRNHEIIKSMKNNN